MSKEVTNERKTNAVLLWLDKNIFIKHKSSLLIYTKKLQVGSTSSASASATSTASVIPQIQKRKRRGGPLKALSVKATETANQEGNVASENVRRSKWNIKW